MRLFLLLVEEEKVVLIAIISLVGMQESLAQMMTTMLTAPSGVSLHHPHLSQQQQTTARLPQQLHSSGVQGFSGLRHCPIKAGSISGCVWNFPNGV
jgi:hypothetical protein